MESWCKIQDTQTPSPPHSLIICFFPPPPPPPPQLSPYCTICSSLVWTFWHRNTENTITVPTDQKTRSQPGSYYSTKHRAFTWNYSPSMLDHHTAEPAGYVPCFLTTLNLKKCVVTHWQNQSMLYEHFWPPLQKKKAKNKAPFHYQVFQGEKVAHFQFNAATRPQKPQGLLGLGSPGQPPQHSHSSWALKVTHNKRRKEDASSTDPGLGLHNGEESLNADADAHTRHLLAIRVKHPHQAIIATAPRHAPHSNMLIWITGSLDVGVTCHATTWCTPVPHIPTPGIIPVNVFKLCCTNRSIFSCSLCIKWNASHPKVQLC